MYCENSSFPGLNTEGGFAEYLRTNERALVRIDPSLEPKDVAAFADAGLTAYRASKKAARQLTARTRCVVMGVGGLGHIAIQCLKPMSPVEIIAADVNERARKLAEETGADHVIEAGEDVIDRVLSLTAGRGVEAVLGFVGEHGVPAQVPDMLRQGAPTTSWATASGWTSPTGSS